MIVSFQSEVSRFWRLANSVSIIQAALLIIGIEPQGTGEYIENWESHKQPDNYIAARDAIVSAIEAGVLEGRIEPGSYETFYGGEVIEEACINYHRSRVVVTSLIHWLEDRGFETSAFGRPKQKPKGFRDPDHPRYSPKLMAVVEA